jgi:carbon-monoxide dehydrogenase medium subunit
VSFRIIQPENLDEALQALTQYGDEAKIIAGGTALVLMLQQKLIAPGVLISLGRIPQLVFQRQEDGYLHLGAMLLLRDLGDSERLQGRYAGLHTAFSEVGNVRVRNQATLGGNLAEADYASDPPTMLLALDASVVASSARGSRTISLSDFFLGFYTTALEPDEILTEARIPPLPAGARSTYLKFKSRSSEDRPCLGVAAVGVFDGDDVCRDLRVAIGAACGTPQRLPVVEGMVTGEVLSDALIAEIAEGYATDIETLEDLRGSAWYRTQMIRVHVARALKELRDGHR